MREYALSDGMEADRNTEHMACDVLSQENRRALLLDGERHLPSCLSLFLPVCFRRVGFQLLSAREVRPVGQGTRGGFRCVRAAG